MAYTSASEIDRKRRLAQMLAGQSQNNPGSKHGQSLSSLAHVLRAYTSGKLEKEAAEAGTANDELRTEELQRLAGALRGETQPPLMPGQIPKFSHPEVQELATMQQIHRSASPTPGPISVSPGERLVDPGTMQEIYSAPEQENFNQPFGPDGTPNQAFMDYQERLRSAGRPNITTNVAGPEAQSKYLEERAKSQAESMASLEKSAESAYRANNALDRFVVASANGDQGAVQPIITGVKNFMASFGLNPDGLTDTTTMQQAIGEILASKMTELGARGLTDRDMEVLREALPRVNTSQDARETIVAVLKQSNKGIIEDYMNQVEFEEENFPEYRFARPSWLRGYDPSASAPARTSALETIEVDW